MKKKPIKLLIKNNLGKEWNKYLGYIYRLIDGIKEELESRGAEIEEIELREKETEGGLEPKIFFYCKRPEGMSAREASELSDWLWENYLHNWKLSLPARYYIPLSQTILFVRWTNISEEEFEEYYEEFMKELEEEEEEYLEE